MDAEIEITGLGRSGEGVGRHQGLVVFVPGAVPGDRCLVRYAPARRSMAKGSLLQILRPSADRQAPICPAFGTCGGCQLQALSYPAELREKTKAVADALARIGHLQADVQPCLGGDPYGYRAKVSWPVRRHGGSVRIGLFSAHSHTVVEEDSCAVAAPQLRAIPVRLREAMRQLGISAYDERSGTLRHVVARRARKGEILVTLVATREDAGLKALAERLMSELPDVAGVALSLNAQAGNRIFGPGPAQVLSGRGEIEEEILGLRFLIGPTSFFQINPAAAEALFSVAAGMAGEGGGREALDLYTGVGVFALLLARAGYATSGVEYAADAVALARRNAERNGLHASFAVGDAQSTRLPGRGALVTLDPPRGGAPQLAQRLAAEGPERIIYVSCDPATLARDAEALVAGGYRLGRVQPVDLFPRTVHVETVAEFLR